jgi:hypothetical protein
VRRPGVFAGGTFLDVKNRARREGKWLIVEAASGASQPSRLMTDVWQSRRVIEWLEAHALALKIDVDVEHALAAELKVRTVPTLIAFKDDGERARVTGFLDQARLLIWLVGLDKPTNNAIERLLNRGTGDLDTDMQARTSFAKALLHDHSYADATEHYVWLWHNMVRLDPGMSGVRVSFMAREIETLVTIHKPARRRFEEIRDRAARAADAIPTSGELRHDWAVLNRVLGDDDRTLLWFESVKRDPDAGDVVRACGCLLIDLLKARRRWADVGRLYRDPLKELASLHKIHQAMPIGMMSAMVGEQTVTRMREVTAAQFRTGTAELYASLRAAGRDADAKAVHAEALRLDPSEAMQTALAASPTRYD